MVGVLSAIAVAVPLPKLLHLNEAFMAASEDPVGVAVDVEAVEATELYAVEVCGRCVG